MRAWITGNVLTGVGLAWLIVDRVLRTFYPRSWGGPNIGGGALFLLAVLSAVIGGTILLSAGRGERRSGRPRGVGRAVSLTMNGLLVAALVVAYVATSGKTQGVDGAVGITVDPDGTPVLVLEICRGSIDTLTVLAPNRGTEPNEAIARLTTQHPVAGSMAVDPGRPPAGWAGAPAPLRVSSEQNSLLVASAYGDDGELRQVDFTAGDLATLGPQVVQYSSYSSRVQARVAVRVARTDFRNAACHPAEAR